MYSAKSVTFMDGQMTSEEAVQIIIDYLDDKDDKVVDVALHMCMIDLASFGVDDWVEWSSLEIVHLFRNVADDTLSDSRLSVTLDGVDMATYEYAAVAGVWLCWSFSSSSAT